MSQSPRGRAIEGSTVQWNPDYREVEHLLELRWSLKQRKPGGYRYLASPYFCLPICCQLLPMAEHNQEPMASKPRNAFPVPFPGPCDALKQGSGGKELDRRANKPMARMGGSIESRSTC